MPSLYETTAAVGDVSSSNFTTLYNASGLTVPNAGAGSVTGNLNVSGNLTVQGTSLLVGPVTLQNTLCLPNYCFPLNDGTTDQVLTTDGSGNLYFTSLSTLGASYTIQADTATGGSNLTLVSSNGVLDSVKFANGTGISVSRTDASTITISATDTNTTYTIDSSTTTGGANLNLVGSDATTDTIKFANGSNVTVTSTDANTISIAAANTTYTQNASSTTGGANLNLVGSDSTTDSVKFAGGTGITVSRTDADTITITNTSPAGTTYSINASSTTGGANFNLVGSDATTDTIKFAAGSNMTITRTNADTITFDATGGSSIPSGTSQGQVLYWDGSAWTASANIASATAGSRLAVTYINSGAGANSALFLRKDYGATNYSEANADGVGMSYTLDSNAQGISSYGLTQFAYSTTDPTFTVASSLNNFSTRTNILALNKANASLYAPELVLNATQTGSPTLDAVITANRGSSTDATITWNETTDRWELNQNTYITGTLSTTGAISTTAESITMNSDSTAADSFLYLKGTSQYIKWDNTNGLITFSDPIFVSQTAIPTTLERKVTAGDVSPTESKNALQLIERVTDAGSNATDDGGTGILFTRTSGASGGAEKLYAQIGGNYFGTTNTAELRFNWSDDNFTETSPGVFPGTYTMLRLGAADANFYNNSLFVDYTTLGAAKVGINTGTPAYTLDVNGDANVSGDIYFNGVQLDINSPQAGQVITYNGTKFLNSATVSWASTAYRTTFQADSGIAGRAQAAANFINNTGATAYGQGDGSGILMGVDSDSQALSLIGSVITQYDAGGDHSFRVSTSTNSFANITATSITGGNTLVFGAAHGLSAGQRIVYLTTTQNGLVQNTYYYVLATGLTTTQCQISLTSGGSAVALTNGSGLTLNFQTGSARVLNANQTELDVTAPLLKLNALGTGVAAVDASIVVERGTTGSDVSIKWNSSTNRWQDTTDGSTFYNLPNQNLDTTDDVNFSSVTIDNLSGFNTQEVTTTSTATTFISTSTRMTQKSIIEITDNVTGEMHVLEALAFRKGTTAYLTTYGEMYTATSLATFTADVAGGFTRILATPASSNSTTFRVARISLD